MSFVEDLEKAIREAREYYRELNGESSRAAAILAMASLEDELARLIRKKFPPDMSETKWKRVCGSGPVPLGTFIARVDVAYAFGFFGPETYKTLNLLATIRNKFAHRTGVRSFIEDSVLEQCRKLQKGPIPNTHGSDKPNENDVRYLYITTVRTIHEGLERLVDHIPEIDGPLDPLP